VVGEPSSSALKCPGRKHRVNGECGTLLRVAEVGHVDEPFHRRLAADERQARVTVLIACRKPKNETPLPG
jgi:hypothetical protein